MQNVRRQFSLFFHLLLSGLLFLGCDLRKESDGTLSNNPSDVPLNSSRVMEVNPVVKVGNDNLSYGGLNLGSFLESTPALITARTELTAPCEFILGGTPYAIDPCFEVQNDALTSPLAPNQGTWAYPPNSLEFLQVNTFYHVDKAVQRFHDSLTFVRNQSQLFPGLTSVPYNFISSKGFWRSNSFSGLASSLKVYSRCGEFANAYFSPSEFLICLGDDPTRSGLRYAQDPSVIYHELGHVFVSVLSNMRNESNSSIVERFDLGLIGYDEAGAINEGIADYFSYVMNERDRFGEWALGPDYLLDRPVSESSSIHTVGIDETPQGRLSYPDFLTYEAHRPQEPIEDIHAAGQITSHYLVALTKSLRGTCGVDQRRATDYVLYLLAETLAEAGDLGAKKNDAFALGYGVHGVPAAAFEMAHYNQAMNYQRFYQILARNIGLYLSSNLCLAFTKNHSESLLDDYGLLLFKTYNEDLDDELLGSTFTPGLLGATDFLPGYRTPVSPFNRIKSVLASKNQLELDPTIEFFVADTQSEIRKVLENLQSSFGIILPTDGPQKLVSPDWTYGDGIPKRGEIVGLMLNLRNTSNVVLAGIDILANPWDHFKLDPSSQKYKPCQDTENQFPSDAASAAPLDGSPLAQGDCGYTTRANGTDAINEPDEKLHPICMINVPDPLTGSTKWVSQAELAPGSTSPYAVPQCFDNSRPESCLVEFIGPPKASFVKLDPGKTLPETLGSGVNLSAANFVFAKLSKHLTPPINKVMCRFRVNFSNCADCLHDDTHDDDNFLAYEYSGDKPFREFNILIDVQQ